MCLVDSIKAKGLPPGFQFKAVHEIQAQKDTASHLKNGLNPMKAEKFLACAKPRSR